MSSDVVCSFSGFTLLFFLLFTTFCVWQIISFILSVRRLFEMYNFYTHLLKIPDVSAGEDICRLTVNNSLG